MKKLHFQLSDDWKKKIRFSTLSFLFIIAYVNIFPMLFGAENNIVAVIFTILMSASMVRDLTGTLLRHFFIQAFVLIWMSIAACLVNILPPMISLLINLITLFIILYAFTYEYANHLYFPYILSYLFLIFISPVPPTLLPRRILAMVAGAFSIIAYQWIMGRKKIKNNAQDILCDMIHHIKEQIQLTLSDDMPNDNLNHMHHKLHALSKIIYDRRKKVLCVSDASFSLIDAGRGLEHLNVLIQELDRPLHDHERLLLQQIDTQLSSFDSFIQGSITELPKLDVCDFDDDKKNHLFYHILLYIRDRLLHMSDPDSQKHWQRSSLSLKNRLITACNFSSVRFVYALRIALLLSLATLFVLWFSLPHGKWLLFTLASVSLPYADDIPVKMKKRILATLLGGLASVLIYSLFASPISRMAAMMLSGYASFYFHDYAATFTCSTIGALGGAVFMSAFGFQANFDMFIIRLGYILAGAILAYIANCIIFPYTRLQATKALWRRYEDVTNLLISISKEKEPDAQLYYSCIIQAHMLEEKLSKNAALENWENFPEYMRQCRIKVYQAHRTHIANRKDAAIFRPEFLV